MRARIMTAPRGEPAVPVPAPRSGAALHLALESRAAMDLLEYQGKQLFARHGLRVSSGDAVTSVEDAVAVADERRLPGRRQGAGPDRRPRQGRRRQARRRRGAGPRARREHPRHGHPRSHGPHALDRARLGHRDRVLRVRPARPLRQEAARDVQRRGRRGHRRGRREDAREAHPPATSTRSRASHARRPRQIATDGGADADVIGGVADALVALYEVWLRRTRASRRSTR